MIPDHRIGVEGEIKRIDAKAERREVEKRGGEQILKLGNTFGTATELKT